MISTFGMWALIVGFAAAIAGVPTVGGRVRSGGQVTRGNRPRTSKVIFLHVPLRKIEVSLEVEVGGFLFGGVFFVSLFLIGDVFLKRSQKMKPSIF